MIRIEDRTVKKQKNFWNACVFHPTDAVEDPWGRRILDRMAKDGAVKTVRIYAMLEDIVYLDEEGGLCFDFRLSDLRLDYLLEQGYDLLLAYAGIPDCIAASLDGKTSVAKGKTRYKGKMWNTSSPKDFGLWEEICRTYTQHNVDRYGIETVSKWRCQCFNEPDIPLFFLSELPHDAVEARLSAYCGLYEAFERGIGRVSEKIPVGGPALAEKPAFLEGFLRHVKAKGLKLDFLSFHSYGTTPMQLNDGSLPFCTDSLMRKYRAYHEIARACGFAHTPLLVDEWGMAAAGFYNREECPALMARETEVFSAYYAKLLCEIAASDLPIEMLSVCLSGQHEMKEDFSGFRNFFTLHFIKKPIYNAHVLASRLGEALLPPVQDGNLFALPTKTEGGGYAVLFSYAAPQFEDVPDREVAVTFAEDISEKTVTVWCIDREHTNPYRLYQKMGEGALSEEDLRRLRREGELAPLAVQKGTAPITLRFTPNAVMLLTVE